jgi:hypothetical protein
MIRRKGVFWGRVAEGVVVVQLVVFEAGEGGKGCNEVVSGSCRISTGVSEILMKGGKSN